MALVNATHPVTDVASEIAVPAKSDRTIGISSVEITNGGGFSVHLGGPAITPTTGGVVLSAGESWYSPALSPDDAVFVMCKPGFASTLNILWIGA